ncbi:MAG: MATE family efflux transporter [Planctomycetia bacterium]|nr:MATE family efflux transporter [Planctomycetia bacterium]
MGSNPVESSATEETQPAAHPPTLKTDPTAIREPDHGMPAGPFTEPIGATEAAGEAEAITHSPPISTSTPGGSKELLRIALPLILSQSFMTVQVFVDTVLLSWYDPMAMAASFPAVMWYWLFFGVLQVTAGYTSTFVAQYTGAARPHRVGPAVWQGIHFAVVLGILFLVVVPLSPWLISLGGHSPEMQRLETIYLQCLSFAALPMLVMGAINGFFSGRGQTWTVLLIEGIGTAVNIALALVLIFGFPRAGIPEMGIAGAGWATVAGSWAAAIFALALMLRRKYRDEFNTLSGWKPERELFGRLMKFGGPAGMQVFLDVLVFHLFTQLVGRLGDAALGATTLTVRLNMIAFLPMMGLGQAICIMVGQRLGENRPDLAEKSTYTGLKWSFGYMCFVALIYVAIPGLLLTVFESDKDPAMFAEIAKIVPGLLLCVAVFSIADAINLSFAFALRGAGDTKYVTLLTFSLAWPLMVIPTALVVFLGGNVYWCWAFATAHIIGMSVCFWFRFRGGKWKSMRVIEPGVAEEGERPA